MSATGKYVLECHRYRRSCAVLERLTILRGQMLPPLPVPGKRN
jgi:hypothetical protein